MQLKAGDSAPEFTLPDADMEMVDFARFRNGQRAVLVFYPKDGTPCCVREMTDFSDHDADFAALDCRVLAVSRDDCLKHAEFRDHEGIGLPLLSDSDGAVCKKYGVWQARDVEGHRKYGVVRSTFIVDRDGTLRHALYNVNYKGHAQEVLRLIKELDS